MKTEEIIAKVRAHREATKASLTGVELMQYNLFWKLRDWIIRETSDKCVCIGDIVEKIGKYAPKAILKDRKQYEKAVKDLWSAAHGYGIDSEDFLREDLEFEMDWIFNSKTI